MSPLAGGPTNENAVFSWNDTYQKSTYFAVLGITALLIYSFWNMLEKASAFWQDDQYSHGYLVPLIAVYLAWSMRPNPMAQDPPEGMPQETFMGRVPASTVKAASLGAFGVAFAAYMMPTVIPFSGLVSAIALALSCLAGLAYVMIGQPFQRVTAGERWIGLAILLVAYAIRIGVGGLLYFEHGNMMAFILALLGAFMMIGGWSFVRWVGPGTGFLLFMYRIPSLIEKPLLLNLQKVAAAASEIVLTILGQPVHREGSVIHMAGVSDPLAVAEACSGLRMLTIFIGFSVACALLIKRPWWDKLMVLLSAIPIALFANITRIVVTALLYRLFPENESVHQLVHDFAGFAMMPLGMGMLLLELKILSTLSQEEEEISSYGGGSLGSSGPMPTA